MPKAVVEFHNAVREKFTGRQFNRETFCSALNDFYKIQEPTNTKEHIQHYMSFLNKNTNLTKQILDFLYTDCAKEFLAWRRFIIADLRKYTKNLQKHTQNVKFSKEIDFMTTQIEMNNARIQLLKMDYDTISNINDTNYKFVFDMVDKVARILCV